MSFPVVSQARDSINQAYVALQNWNTNPANIPLPDVVDTSVRGAVDLNHVERLARGDLQTGGALVARLQFGREGLAVERLSK